MTINRDRLNPIGQRYGRWTVVSEAPIRSTRQRYMNCVCACGTEKQVSFGSLRSGGTASCGCLTSEVNSLRFRTHGMSDYGPEYDIWVAMVSRCTKDTALGYKNYGGRGIKVCARWLDVRNFLADMGKRPTAKHSIERVDNNAGYSPENCIWGTKDQQVNNTRRNKVLEFRGRRMTWKQASDAFKIEYDTLRQRFRNGWSVEAALTTPVNTRLANNRRNPPQVFK